MKRLSAAILAAILAVGSSGCISVHKTETHEAGRSERYMAANDHRGQPEDCHDAKAEVHHRAGH